MRIKQLHVFSSGQLPFLGSALDQPAGDAQDGPTLSYQELAADRFPTVTCGEARVKILSGEFAGQADPLADPLTDLLFLDISLEAGGALSLPPGDRRAAFLYPFEGDLRVEGTPLRTHELGVLGPGDELRLTAEDNPVRLILVAGRPIGEPIVQQGPFVMNSREEIEQAFRDFRDGRLVQEPVRATS